MDKTTGKARGSTQANDVLQFEEFEYLMEKKENKERIKIFRDDNKINREFKERDDKMIQILKSAVNRLKSKVERFAKQNFTNENSMNKNCKAKQVKNDLMIFDNYENVDDAYFETSSSGDDSMNSPKERQLLSNLCHCSTPSTPKRGESSQRKESRKQKKEPHSCTKLIEIVIDCKIFIKNLHSVGNEGTLIDIFSFMKKDVELNYLKLIYELSEIQSKAMDIAINERIYNEHLENKRIKGYKHAIVQGAGPVGLYAAYKLFMGKKIKL